MGCYIIPTFNYNFEPIIRFENEYNANDYYELDIIFASFAEAEHYALLIEKQMDLNTDIMFVNVW